MKSRGRGGTMSTEEQTENSKSSAVLAGSIVYTSREDKQQKEQLSSLIGRTNPNNNKSSRKRKRSESFKDVNVKQKSSGHNEKKKAPLPKEIKQDFLDNLDHIVALGTQIDHSKSMYNKWIEKNFNRSNHEQSNQSLVKSNSDYFIHITDTMSSKLQSRLPNSRKGVKNVSSCNRLIHPEDQILYSNMRCVSSHLEKRRWKKQITPELSITSLFRWPIHLQSSLTKKELVKEKCSRKKSGVIEDEGSGQEYYKTKGISTECDTSLDVNTQWDLEYGDGINYKDFIDRFTSAEKDKKKSNTDGREHLWDEESQDEDELILNDIICKAWEKAVCIASTTVSFKEMDATDDNSNCCSQTNEVERLKKQSNIRNSREKSKQQIKNQLEGIPTNQARSIMICKDLNIMFDPIQVFNDGDGLSYNCQSCKARLRYISNEEVMNHLFGTNGNELDGCCWNIVNLKHFEAIKNTLTRESINIIDGLLHIVFTNAKKRSDQIGKDDAIANPLNWIDVINFAREELTSRKLKVPNILNSNILNVTLRRLFERYGDLPRHN
mmetsp:Transcript_30516/g.35568  ORF Transcript_30516/g.35568 Transcript_30516/m.35568 type:complete len:550 (+) Transcript_30516:1-1650(+)